MFDAYTNLGAALDDLGRDREAERALTRSLEIRETARALNSLGAIRAYQKRDLEASQYYERAVAIDSQDYYYWLNLGDATRRLGRLPEASRAYGKAMNLAKTELEGNPRLGLTRAYVAYLSARLGDSKRAEEEIGQAMELSPRENKVIRKAVLVYEALHQRNRAIEVLSGASPELLHELDRQPDLADFRQDSRFRALVAKIAKGGE
jgi:Flp pilus assembly protein TadD